RKRRVQALRRVRPSRGVYGEAALGRGAGSADGGSRLSGVESQPEAGSRAQEAEAAARPAADLLGGIAGPFDHLEQHPVDVRSAGERRAGRLQELRPRRAARGPKGVALRLGLETQAGGAKQRAVDLGSRGPVGDGAARRSELPRLQPQVSESGDVRAQSSGTLVV